MSTISLLFLSNVFMTVAWYGHLEYGHDWPLWKAILVSWSIALIEYCLAVPANRLGYGEFSGFQLKIIQEVITLVVFIVFAIAFLKERLAGTIWWPLSFSVWRRFSPSHSRLLPSPDPRRTADALLPRRRPWPEIRGGTMFRTIW
jgi:uncharacterized protein (DUF486 family)